MAWTYEYLILYALIGILTAVIYYIRKSLNYWKDRGIPYEEPHVLAGNMVGFRKTRTVGELFDAVYKKFKGTGPFCGFFFFQRPTVLVLDKQLAKNVLIKDFTNFADRGVYHNVKDDPLSGHLFAVDGVLWKQLRQKLSPTFTSGKMKFMFPVVVEVAEEFIRVLGEELTAKHNVIEIKDLLARFTTDVIGTCAFGIECNSLRDPNAEFRVMGREVFTKPRHIDVVMGFMQSFPDLARKFHLRQFPDNVADFFMRIVRETVAYREEHKIKRNDFMDLLIELKNNRVLKGESGESETGLTVEQVAAQAFVFFLAGFETSSTAMSFALYSLALQQDVQDKLRKEVNEVFAKHNNHFTYECMKDLKYLEQVLLETLRLYTILPILQRRAIEDYVVPGHPKYVIEKGTILFIPSASFHLDAEFYPEPHKFKPERFAPELAADRDNIEFLAFGEGPRNCIGLRFGKMQSRIGLALLVKNFKFSTCEQTQIPLKMDPKSFLLASDGGIQLRADKL